MDEFDKTSVHVGAVDGKGRLAGTARVILPADEMLPTLGHCSVTPFARPLWGATKRWVEVSRLSVSRGYGQSDDAIGAASDAPDRGEILLAVSKAVYLASKRVQATHWLVSIERSLQRLLSRSGFPFRQLGPQFDYLGPVAAYSMDLAEFEEIARSGRYPHIGDFVAGEDDYDESRAESLPSIVPPALAMHEQARYSRMEASV
jgi:N-acyl amino acid synthase of PEP-CTERM/exosortase system